MTEFRRTQYIDPQQRVYESVYLRDIPISELDRLTEFVNELKHTVYRAYPYYDDTMVRGVLMECYLSDMSDDQLMLLKLVFS